MTTDTYRLPALPVTNSWVSDVLQVVGASLFIVLCAQIRIPLWFTPVPLSGQVFAVMLIGTVLGSRKGALAVMAYLLQGMIGLPVFAGGACGMLKLVGPTGGYLFGFVVQAYIAGFLWETAKTTASFKVLTVLACSCLVQLAMGTAWLSMYTGLNLQTAWVAGFLPFIIGDALKCIAVTAIYKSRT